MEADKNKMSLMKLFNVESKGNSGNKGFTKKKKLL